MFESITYESILQKMLDQIPNTLDKREGSVIWDALSPAAIELQKAYIALDEALNETFADTASYDFLVRRAAEVGITPLPATKAVLRGEFSPTNIDVTGLRFGLNDLTFIAKEKISDGIYEMECESAGAQGNLQSGNLIPISYINGLTSAVLTSVSSYGEDAETTESLRERYFTAVAKKAQDGNISQYKKWAEEFSGIGRVRVLPLWDGANTVKVSILNSEQRKATADDDGLIAKFQKYLDPMNGAGEGAAPIGAIVTVSTAEEVPLIFTANIALASGYTEISGVSEAVTAYLKDQAYVRDTISYVGVGAAILSVPCVDRVQNLKINNGTADIALGQEQIAVYSPASIWEELT